MTDTINYAQMMQKAMQGLMIDVLKKTSINGLPAIIIISFHLKRNQKALKWLIG
jgi:hypothetical protein